MRIDAMVAVVFTLLCGSASAADLPLPAKAPTASAPVPFSWTGFYIGGNIGYAWNAGSLDNVGYVYGPDYGSFGNGWFGTQSSSVSNSITGGAQLGYNYQVGQLVFGVETDLSYMNASQNYRASSAVDLQPYPVDRPDYNYHLREQLTASTSVDWLGTIRARIGATPIERLLIYATGGVAYGNVTSEGGYNWHEYGFWWGGPGDHFFNRKGGFAGSQSSIRWGWTVGGGAEYALTNAITVRAEYLYVDLGGGNYSIAEAPGGDEFVTWNGSTKLNIARVGVNYKF